MTEEEISLTKAALKKEDDAFGRWSWFALVEKLAMGDITKFYDVYKQNFISCLNLLSYWHEKEKRIDKIKQTQNTQDYK